MTESIGMHERRRVFVLAVDIPDDEEVIDAWDVGDELPAEWKTQIVDARAYPEDAKRLLAGEDL